MTLRLRLVLGLVAVALLLAAPLGLALRALSHAERTASTIRTRDVAASLLLGRVREVVQELRRADLAIVTVPDDSAGAQYLASKAAALRVLADSVRPYGLPAFAAQMARTAAVLETDGPAEADAAARHDTEAADRISTQRVGPAIDAVERGLGDASRTIGARSDLHVAEVLDATVDAHRQAGLLLVAAAAGALAVAVWLTRSVGRPVRALERGLAAVAGGDFAHTLDLRASRRDEFGRLAVSFEQMAAKLAELDKLKSAFVSVASHELKTPINVILGYLALVDDGLYGPVAEPQRGVLATIQRQANTLARLVQHLLDVSRFEAGVARLELRPVALRGILLEAEQSHAVLARQHDVTFCTEFAPGLPDVVTWDADRVREVLDNLLSNAVKFTPAGGRVTLGAAPDRRRHPPSLRLSVRDTGFGIPSDQLPRVFDKFYQADNQGGASAKGTGLGLAISKEIVEAHGGFITVDSAPGVQTEFVVTLPLTAHDATLGGPTDATADDPNADGAEPPVALVESAG
ncbi:hypothetical protein tb265_28470 [Gemmatimonadetes bacterium T265]|nr:hypothetical protein tb265_28470 [Gemmatimonadetes bacterium T265]